MTKIKIDNHVITLQCTMIGKLSFIRVYHDNMTTLCADILGVYSCINRLYGIEL